MHLKVIIVEMIFILYDNIVYFIVNMYKLIFDVIMLNITKYLIFKQKSLNTDRMLEFFTHLIGII